MPVAIAERHSPVRALAEQAFSRAAGAPLVAGNGVRLLLDAEQNYPAWLDAIRRAKRWIHFECYIFSDDVVGREFAAALAEKARQGVRVRVLYDWLGNLGQGTRRLAASLRAAGAEVRCFNPPRLDSPFGWLRRDHRKMVAADGAVGCVTGLCVSARWVGDSSRGIDSWRDTGVEVRGPAVAEIERAFAEVWAETGEALPADEVPEAEDIPEAGEMAVRVVASAPSLAGLYRLDQLIAAMARKTLWLTDAYFVGTAAYVNALRAAALDGVDVRLLVPGSSDVPVLRPVTTAGYRALLEAGIRVFEWNGSMMHAKTAVADGRWARVGSTNLNVSSWIGNYELDVAVEDEGFAAEMERAYLQDLEGSTEIVLQRGRRVRPVQPRVRASRRSRRGSASRVAAGALRLGNTVEAAITSRRLLGPAEARTMALGAMMLLTLAVVAALWPQLVAFPVAALSAWVGLALLVGARRALRRRGAGEALERRPVEEKGPLEAP